MVLGVTDGWPVRHCHSPVERLTDPVAGARPAAVEEVHRGRQGGGQARPERLLRRRRPPQQVARAFHLGRGHPRTVVVAALGRHGALQQVQLRPDELRSLFHPVRFGLDFWGFFFFFCFLVSSSLQRFVTKETRRDFNRFPVPDAFPNWNC